MIGHWLLTLTAEEEGVLLGQPIEPVYQDSRSRLGLGSAAYDCYCLVGRIYRLPRHRKVNNAVGVNHAETERIHRPDGTRGAPGYLYESLCVRFGLVRVNAAIRNRILANQARRVLGSARRALLERAK